MPPSVVYTHENNAWYRCWEHKIILGLFLIECPTFKLKDPWHRKTGQWILRYNGETIARRKYTRGQLKDPPTAWANKVISENPAYLDLAESNL